MPDDGAGELRENSARRRRNLRIAVQKVGGLAKFCTYLGVTRQRIHQLSGPKPTENLGSVLARKIEKTFGYPANWMDNDHDDLGPEDTLVADALEFMETAESAKDRGKIQELLQDLARIQRREAELKQTLKIELGDLAKQKASSPSFQEGPINGDGGKSETLPPKRMGRSPTKRPARVRR